MPDTSTEVAIATTTLGSAATTIEFASISSSYTDLRLVLTATVSSAGQAIRVRFNSDSSTGSYSHTYLVGDGGGAGSYLGTSLNQMNLDAATSGASTTIPTLYTLDIFSYAGSTYKTALLNNSGDRNGSGFVASQVNLWRNTAAIDNIKILVPTGTLNTGTTATLYGIL
jgi:hypothetical protein